LVPFFELLVLQNRLRLDVSIEVEQMLAFIVLGALALGLN